MSETYTTELISNIKDAMNLPEYSEIAPTLTKKTKRIIDFISQGKNNSKLSSSELVNTADELINKGIDTIKEGGMLSKHASLSSTKNKLITAQLQMGDTALGSACAKTALKSKNVLTYGGGLLSLYFTASALLNAYKASQEAPKGEKKSTFMHVLSEQYVGLILFQPSINLFYKICGNKYRGMTKDSRNFLKDLVKAANTNETITKEGIKIAKLQRNLLIKGVDKSKVALLAKKSYREAKSLAKTLEGQGAKLKFWEKPLKFAGKILSLGLDNIKKAKTLKLPVKLPLIGNKIKLPKPTASGVLGGAIRFAIIMFVLQPLLQKPITKLTHKIFGEPKTYLAKQKQKERDNETQFKAETNPASYEVPKSSETNLIKLWTNK